MITEQHFGLGACGCKECDYFRKHPQLRPYRDATGELVLPSTSPSSNEQVGPLGWTLEMFVRDGLDRCRKMAAAKTDEHRQGWLDDEWYWSEMLKRVQSEKACSLCASGMNSFIDPDTGKKMHARNGTVSLCSAVETSRDAPDYEPVDFDHAVAVVRHFENYEYPPTFTDWTRCLAALRSMVNWVAKRRQLKIPRVETPAPQGWMCACGTFNYAACCQECHTMQAETNCRHIAVDEPGSTLVYHGFVSGHIGDWRCTICNTLINDGKGRGGQKTNCVDGREGHKAEQVSALRESGLPASQREPPHCSTCSCGMDKP